VAERAGGADAGEAADAGASAKAHQQGLGLVVGMVGGEQERQASTLAPAAKGLVAGGAGFGLKAGFAVGDDDREGFVANAEARAEGGDGGGLGSGFGAQAVVDGGGLDAAGKGRRGEQKQSEAVGAARHGEAGLIRDADKRSKLAAEAFNQ
jgi:hypothetical protein